MPKVEKKIKPVLIRRIVYARLKNLGDFENERLEAEVTIQDNEDAIKEMRRLRRWVNKQLEIDED